MKEWITLLVIGLAALACAKDEEPVMPELPVLHIDPIEVEEGDNSFPIYITLRLSKPSADTVIAFVESVDGTAKGGEDFESVNFKPVAFAPGDLREEYRVNILGDEEFEGDEEFVIKIADVVGAEIGTGEATITLLEDDINTGLFIPEDGYTSPASYPNMELIWQDEFEGTAVNSDFWTFELGTGNNGWGNNESQYYRKENTYLVDGNLVIEARKENFAGRAYTSSRMITKGNFDFKYGRVDIRAALPYGQGIWPALWMLGANISTVGWPACGEIDIMELIGHQPSTVHGTAHWSNAGQHAQFGGSTTLSSGRFYDEFHVFSIEWDAQRIRWLLDGQEYHNIDITPADLSEFRNDFFFIFNVAVGGNWPGYPDGTTVFPQRMIVDYIRVFQDN
ncbi:MAG: glycoside hydrolase family 16 protein [Phaeodactylibacter sp.]|nr:glycoside hydrolase family 16 protein [Phaeodactylibacter sp.]MCB9266799.1 glycoside hydrolase family 16 protein [Lewinellaceae bacterium]MCB9287689.1 glycoside hydrolase family 16 protein [Lewinellaceae bacterium]